MLVDEGMKELVAKMANEHGWFFGERAKGAALAVFIRKSAELLSRLDPCDRERVNLVLDNNTVFIERVSLDGREISRRCSPDAPNLADGGILILQSPDFPGKLNLGDRDKPLSDYNMKFSAGTVTLRDFLERSGLNENDFERMALDAMELEPKMNVWRSLSAAFAQICEQNQQTTDNHEVWDDEERENLRDIAAGILARLPDSRDRAEALDKSFVIMTSLTDDGAETGYYCSDMDASGKYFRRQLMDLRDSGLAAHDCRYDDDYASDERIMETDMEKDWLVFPGGRECDIETVSARKILERAELEPGEILKEAGKIRKSLQGEKKRQASGQRPR